MLKIIILLIRRVSLLKKAKEIKQITKKGGGERKQYKFSHKTLNCKNNYSINNKNDEIKINKMNLRMIKNYSKN